MRSSALQEIMISVEGLPIPSSAKAQVLRVISQVGLLHGNSGVERLERVMTARGLLDEKTPRPMIRDRLMATFHISKRQAYRAIDEALQLCQKSPLNGTTNHHTKANEKVILGKENG